MSAAQTRNLTILLTDLQGFTEKTSRKSRSEVLAMLEKHKEIVLPVLEARGGKLIKTIGDAFLMVFESPTDAVLSGVEVQEALLKYNHGRTGDDRLDVRIAINVGEVSLTDDDIFGEPVNITARIEAIAEAGEVYFSEGVYLAMNKREVPTSEIGFRKLKGIAEEIKLYKVKREIPVEELPPEEPASAPAKENAEEPAPPVPVLAAPGLPRRAGALLIDFLICSMAFGIFFGTQKIHDADRHDDRQAREKLQTEIDEKGIKVKISDDKLKVGDIEISEKGIQGKKISLSEDGLKLSGGMTAAEGAGAAVQEIGEALGEAAAAIEVANKKSPRPRPKSKKNKRAFPFFWFAYGTFFLTIWSATPGKRAFGLRVVNAHTPSSAPLEWKTAALRSFISVFPPGYLIGPFTHNKRALHDLVAKTRVIRG